MRTFPAFWRVVLLFLPVVTGISVEVRAGSPGDSTLVAPSAVCPDPIELASVNVVNTLCGLATGIILINVEGGNSNYTFQWEPDISSSNTAIALPAAAYTVTIVRTGQPECTLDTTIIVNNTNGPQAEVTSLTPSTCLASNGAVTLSPTNLFYVWNNGEVGAVNDGLQSICYYVTATDPGAGCYSVIRVCVPNVNPLESSVQVVENAKCGRGTGSAQMTVTGGSGQYSYSLGALPFFSGLVAGDYVAVASDNETGCMTQTPFTIQDLQVSATVEITPYNITCPGGGNGFVGFEVIPGANFEMPFIFAIRDTANLPFQAGNLAPGKYYLYIADADSCTLPVDSFYITQPDPIVTQATVLPETCQTGGEIHLTFSGGNGGYRVDWVDLPGAVNPVDRINLPAGIYRAVVFDSLFCTDTLDAFLVPSLCARLDTLPLLVPAGEDGSICVEIPIGVQPGNVDFELTGGGTSGSSAHGSWALLPNGCLVYQAGATPGFAVDTICIVADIGQIGLQDTTCVIVSILSDPPSEEVVAFTVQADNAASACGTIPPVLGNPLILQLDRPGLDGVSGAYGVYSIDTTTACITFSAYALPGFNIDTITVAACDLTQMECHLIHYLPSVLPKVDCSTGFVPADSLVQLTTNCAAGGLVCLPIPYGDIIDFAILNNGLPYLGGFLGCDVDTAIAYSISLLPPGGPYQLNEWSINGQTFSGAFQDVNGLVALMNQLDPTPGWTFENNFFIVGGSQSNNYGDIRVTSAQAVVGVLQPNLQFIPRGSELRFSAGDHEVILRHIQTGCADTVSIRVECVDCPPIHNYPLDFWGYVEWEAPGCAADTLFCTNIPVSELDDYVISDNFVPVGDFEPCANGFVGMRFDTGWHHLRIRNTVNTCEYTVYFYFDCLNNVSIDDTVSVSLPVGQSTVVCPGQGSLVPPVISIANLCEPGFENALLSLDQQSFCATLTGTAAGLDTFCLQICNGNGACATTAVFVTVTPAAQDTLTEARPDAATTVKNTPVQIAVLANDVLENGLGNLAALADFRITTPPQLGEIEFDAASGLVRYTPAGDTCGTDQFIYRIEDTRGVRDTALVRVTITCDDLLIFNGFSPNGDSRNDVWHILGIEDYPANTVQVFNRWGNLVFEQKGYVNQSGWDGRWNGKDLPDGTYYYVIDLGKGGRPLSGYLQLMR